MDLGKDKEHSRDLNSWCTDKCTCSYWNLAAVSHLAGFYVLFRYKSRYFIVVSTACIISVVVKKHTKNMPLRISLSRLHDRELTRIYFSLCIVVMMVSSYIFVEKKLFLVGEVEYIWCCVNTRGTVRSMILSALKQNVNMYFVHFTPDQ